VLLSALENSLRQLRTDSVDICYFHTPDYKVRLEESLAAMEEAVRAGMVRYAATSKNWLLHHTTADCLVLGASSAAQLEANLAAMEEGRLSEEALRAAETVWQTLRGPAPKYNR